MTGSPQQPLESRRSPDRRSPKMGNSSGIEQPQEVPASFARPAPGVSAARVPDASSESDSPPALFQLPDLSAPGKSVRTRVIKSDASVDSHQNDIRSEPGSSIVSHPADSSDGQLHRIDGQHNTAFPSATSWKPVTETEHPNDAAFAQGLDELEAERRQSPTDDNAHSPIDPESPLETSLETWGARAVMISLLLLVVTCAAVAVRKLKDTGEPALTDSSEVQSANADTVVEMIVDPSQMDDADVNRAVADLAKLTDQAGGAATMESEPPAPSTRETAGSVLAAASPNVSDPSASDPNTQSTVSSVAGSSQADVASEVLEGIGFDDPFFSDIQIDFDPAGVSDQAQVPERTQVPDQTQVPAIENSGNASGPIATASEPAASGSSFSFKAPAEYEEAATGIPVSGESTFAATPGTAPSSVGRSNAQQVAETSLANEPFNFDNAVVVEPVSVEPISDGSEKTDMAYRYSRTPLPVTDWTKYFFSDDAYMASGPSNAERQ